MQPTIAANTLFYGDNLLILREYIPDESIDLVYLDPPFNSNRNYSVLFKDESGKHSEAQIEAFEDTWHWSEHAEATFRDLVTESPAEVGQAIKALRELIGTNQVMAYLVMMAARLVELHRVLRPTGSLYLHCVRPDLLALPEGTPGCDLRTHPLPHGDHLEEVQRPQRH